MQNLMTKTVGEIALEMPIATRVFEDFKIDYCCGGKRLFTAACQTAGANPDTVVRKIEDVLETTDLRKFEWLKDTKLSELIDYILQKHHVFTKDEIRNLMPLMEKVVNRHGQNHLELFELEKLFKTLCNDQSTHLLKEEEILFPYIEKMEISESIVASFCFGTVQNPIRMMMSEHDTAGDILRKMRDLTHDYRLPEGACLSFSALYGRLEAFEFDLHQHIHLENNILFPRAVELEEKVFS